MKSMCLHKAPSLEYSRSSALATLQAWFCSLTSGNNKEIQETVVFLSLCTYYVCHLSYWDLTHLQWLSVSVSGFMKRLWLPSRKCSFLLWTPLCSAALASFSSVWLMACCYGCLWCLVFVCLKYLCVFDHVFNVHNVFLSFSTPSSSCISVSSHWPLSPSQ